MEHFVFSVFQAAHSFQQNPPGNHRHVLSCQFFPASPDAKSLLSTQSPEVAAGAKALSGRGVAELKAQNQ